MISVTTFAGRQVAVFGLGRSGILAARALQEGGADVVAFDDEGGKTAETLRHRRELREALAAVMASAVFWSAGLSRVLR